MEFLIIIIILFFAYLLLKPKKIVKSRKEKQAEIARDYKKKLDIALRDIDDTDTRITRKTALIKVFANELKRNLFFDENEARALVKELAEYEAKKP